MKTGHSIEDRIIAFFLDNPHEELSIDDMAVKFGRSRLYVQKALSRLRSAGHEFEKTLVLRLKPKDRAP